MPWAPPDSVSQGWGRKVNRSMPVNFQFNLMILCIFRLCGVNMELSLGINLLFPTLIVAAAQREQLSEYDQVN